LNAIETIAWSWSDLDVSRFLLQALFNNDHAVVKVGTVDGAMRARHGLRLIMKIGVNVVDDLFGDFNECLAPAISAVKCR
jgi:hypothetical protein